MGIAQLLGIQHVITGDLAFQRIDPLVEQACQYGFPLLCVQHAKVIHRLGVLSMC